MHIKESVDTVFNNRDQVVLDIQAKAREAVVNGDTKTAKLLMEISVEVNAILDPFTD